MLRAQLDGKKYFVQKNAKELLINCIQKTLQNAKKTANEIGGIVVVNTTGISTQL